MLNDLLLIILSASCAALLFYYLRRLPLGNSRPASLLLLAPKTDPLLAHFKKAIQRHQLREGGGAFAREGAPAGHDKTATLNCYVGHSSAGSSEIEKQQPLLPPTPYLHSARSPRPIVPSSSPPIASASPLPPLTLLKRAKYQSNTQKVAHKQARLITETLAAFDIPAKIVQINQGPTITQFGLQPGFIQNKNGKRRKIKVSAITALTNDLALALSAKSLRIYPVPGKPYLGLELPNHKAQPVTLESVLTSRRFAEIYQTGGLPIALGRDITGQPIAADLFQMPHALIAGATGSGKSVCLNAIIASLLFNYSSHELKFVMIDPKMVELIGYNGLPHLISPVITDMEKVVGALQWAVSEMEKRYKLLSLARQRDITNYNQWAKANNKETLPTIVLIIDELADLMMTTPDDIEQLICRLAQKARAIGIHLILATQRPTVNVVTGLIKANIPTRIAFAVTSSVDSRVILDTKGAESLLGRGDMLYQASNTGHLQRLQGCFVSDTELQALVQHWLTAPTAHQTQEIPWHEYTAPPTDASPTDPLLDKAITLIQQHQHASTSFLQRKLRIGYSRAARLIDELEEKGIIGKAQKGQKREVLNDGDE